MNWNSYPNIAKLREFSEETHQKLSLTIRKLELPRGVCVTIFGSFARKETGPHSDLDWTLISSGDLPNGKLMLTKVANAIRTVGLSVPKTNGAFATITNAEPLWKQIALKSDNRDFVSKRMLILLESSSFGDVAVSKKLTMKIFDMYEKNESFVPGFKYHVPRYFLNDLFLFWRLMVTDYAATSRGPGWGLRVLKMAMSRKILFLSGLIWVTSLRQAPGHTNEKVTAERLYEMLRATSGQTPLERVGNYFALHKTRGSDPLLKYDRFLESVHDTKFRNKLERMNYKKICQDAEFLAAWENARAFHADIINTLYKRDRWMNDFLTWAGVV